VVAASDHPAAVGRLEADPGSPWVGFVQEGEAYHLVYSSDAGDWSLARPTSRRELLAIAIAYVTEALPDPPPELEATHADLAGLLEWLRDSASDTAERGLLSEALDAVDDGLAEDVVVHRLVLAAGNAFPGTRNEQADDWVGLLVQRYRSLSGA
jgi:hypothetical protein